MKKTLRIVVVIAFVGLSLAAFILFVSTYPSAVEPATTCNAKGACFYVDRDPQLANELYAYNTALARQRHVMGAYLTAEILLITLAAVAWVLAGSPIKERREL
jgi:hypothetical protein